MAINGRFKVSMGDVFPHGAYVVGEVEAVRDWEHSTRERPVQATDKESGLLVWAVSVLDPDPDARKDVKTVTVKISARCSRSRRRRWRGCRSGRWSSTA